MQISHTQNTRPYLLTTILFAFALRLYKLGGQSLWYDETVSVELARKSIPGLLAHTAGDIHPPGYYLLLHAWEQLTRPLVFASSPTTGQLEFLYAWPSFCAGVLLIALLYTLGRKLYSPNVGLIAATLAAINAYQIWYSQEVRMYTIIAALSLICLYTLLKWFDQPASQNNTPLIAYALCAAAGLYIHYYLIFSLIALNLIAFWFVCTKVSQHGKWIRNWIGAQIGTLMLWLPWLPTFWQQATDPPVPPWREPWTLSTFGQSLAETISALAIGQSLPSQWSLLWVTLLGTIGVALFLVATRTRPDQPHHGPPARGIISLYAIGPILLLYTITALGPPVYHVRYLFLFAPLFLLPVARGLWAAWQHKRPIYHASGIALISLNIFALQQFWHTPTHQADDHRAAVIALADQWRPGDLILVNAGWTYTALNTYWPAALNSALDSLPPQLSTRQRLIQTQEPSANQPQILYTGTIDGDPNLGWGSPTSDFYALPQTNAEQALTSLANQHARIWHYRLYDTNSDPNGVIRTWFDQNATQLSDQLFAGPASLRVQLFETGNAPPTVDAPQTQIDTSFGNALLFDYAQKKSQIPAGERLYIHTIWTPQPELASIPADLRFSLRLYRQSTAAPEGSTPEGDLITQLDQPALPPTSTWIDRSTVQQTLALPIPIGTPPGTYSVELVIYREDTGEPLSLPEAENTIFGQRLKIGRVDVLPAQSQFVSTGHIASFDYIELVTAETDRAEVAAGESMQIQLTWLPRANPYADTYNAVIELQSTAGDKQVLQTWREPAGGTHYPSGAWLAEQPVFDRRNLPLDPTIPAGRYQLVLRLERASDGLPIDAQRGWRKVDSVLIAAVQLQ